MAKDNPQPERPSLAELLIRETPEKIAEAFSQREPVSGFALVKLAVALRDTAHAGERGQFQVMTDAFIGYVEGLIEREGKGDTSGRETALNLLQMYCHMADTGFGSEEMAVAHTLAGATRRVLRSMGEEEPPLTDDTPAYRMLREVYSGDL